MKKYTIVVSVTGYVGLSLEVLLAQHNEVYAVNILLEKVEMNNNHKFPILEDNYIKEYLAENKLNLTVTLETKFAYSNADFVIIATPTNVYLTKLVR